ncbi:LysR substrate-binding domain-containing protein [Acetobacter sp. KSO5]|uniref:LysR substrate-binding domain-containing protein n=1 Tax=Acetobacter sp. KSO5 TaxID=3373674 RepID=UPI00376F0943
MTKPDMNHLHLRRLNLNLLYTLDAILNSDSLTEAGRHIRLSQPAMSVAFKKLRDQFDDELIIYLAGDRVLTPLAEKLRPRVKRLLMDLNETFNLQIDFDPKTSRKTFRLAASESLATMLLGRVVPRMLMEAENINVIVSSLNKTIQAELFESGVDMVITPQSGFDPNFPSLELMMDRLSCMVWEHHPLIKSNITFEEYLAARHVAVSDTSDLSSRSGEILSRRRIVATTSRYGTLPELIIGTDLVATGSSWVLQYYASMLPVKVLPLPFPTEQTAVLAQWPDHRTSDPAHHWLMAHVSGFTETHRQARAIAHGRE